MIRDWSCVAVSLEVTRKCNFNCKFCYCVWHEKKDSRPELSADEWCDIIKMLDKKGVHSLTITGGEPLLRADISAIMECAASSKIKRKALFTNSSLLSASFLKQMKEWEFELYTSLPGLAGFGKATGTRRTYNKTLSFLERAKELGIHTGVSITVTTENLHELEKIICAASIHEADSILLVPFMHAGRGLANPGLAIDENKWWELVVALKQKVLPDNLHFGDEIHCTCHPHKKSQAACGAGHSFFVISPSGGIRNCLHTKTEIASANDFLKE